MSRRGNCYVTCEALYHLLGGKEAGYVPHCMRWEGDNHWYLVKQVFHCDGYLREEIIIDPTASQFKVRPKPFDYHRLAVAKGFLTKKPSKRAAALMEQLVWQNQL